MSDSGANSVPPGPKPNIGEALREATRSSNDDSSEEPSRERKNRRSSKLLPDIQKAKRTSEDIMQHLGKNPAMKNFRMHDKYVSNDSSI